MAQLEDMCNQAGRMNYSFLQGGKPYVGYRFLLYFYDFNLFSAIYPQGSAGGVYLFSSNLPPEMWRSSSSVRIISSKLPGISSNHVLSFIINDVVDGTINGIDGSLPDGTPCKIFLDLAGFIGDYPEAAHTK